MFITAGPITKLGPTGQNISHLFGQGTTVLIGPVWYLGLFCERSGPMVFRKVTQDQLKQAFFKFQPLRTNFEATEFRRSLDQ